MEISFTVNSKRNLAIVYGLTVVGQMVFVGVEKFSSLSKISEAMANSEFRDRMKAMPEASITLTVFGVFDDILSARSAADRWIDTLKPWCNLHGTMAETPAQGVPRRVMCITDGREFPSISAAADHYGISRPSLQNHLAEKAGYRHVKNLIFKRIV